MVKPPNAQIVLGLVTLLTLDFLVHPTTMTHPTIVGLSG